MTVIRSGHLVSVTAMSRKLAFPKPPRYELVGRSDAILRIKDSIHRLANCDATVLVCGETGTGKEVAARAIHMGSARSAGPFVCINCSAIPDGLAESELFGAEKGAFTGAGQRQNGQIKNADSGTLLLDEIGDMSLLAQAKILRVVENKEVQRLGGGKPEPVDVRILAATHQDLEKLIAARQFRTDLFFRLNVLPLTLPPLRERPEDIPLLVETFIEEFNAAHGRDLSGVTSAAMQLLMEHHWPGNIRELRNVLEGAFIVAESREITIDDLKRLTHITASASPMTNMVRSYILPAVPVQSEPDRLLDALHATHWNKSEAAKLLHWSRMTVYRKIAKYHLPSRKPAASTGHPALPKVLAAASNLLV